MEKFLLSLLCLLTVAFAGSAEEKTYQFETGTANGITDDQEGSWTNGNPGFNFTSNQAPGNLTTTGAKDRGISTSQTGSITSDKEFSGVTKITVDVSSNSTGNTFTVEIGDNVIGSTKSIANSNHQTLEFTSDTPLTGKIKFSVTRSSKTVWIAGFKVEESEASAPVEETQCAKPVAKVGDKTLQHNDKVTVGDVLSLSCATEGATIKYSLGLDGNTDELVEYTEPITLNKAEFLVLKATAVKEGLEDSETLEISFDVERKAAEVAFSRATAMAYLDALDDFKAPTLSYPSDLNVIYSSSNPEVADIDNTGNLTIKAAGETTITAKTAMTEIFEVGSASYTLIVNESKPNLVEYTATFDFVNNLYGQEVKSDQNYMAIGTSFSEKDVKLTSIGEKTRFYKGTYDGVESIDFRVNKSTNKEDYGFSLSVPEGNSIISIEIYDKGGKLKDGFTYTPSSETTETGLWEGEAESVTLINKSDATISMSKIIVRYLAEPVKPEMPELEGDFVLTDNELRVDDSNVKSVRIKFNRKNTTHDIYYKLTASTADTDNGQGSDPNSVNGGIGTTPLATRAAAEHDHTDFTKLEGDEIEVNNSHSQLAYYVCDPETGAHSETKTLSLAVGSTAVAEVEMAEGEAKYFDLQGREVKGALESGIYVRVKNGKSTKVLIK